MIHGTRCAAIACFVAMSFDRFVNASNPFVLIPESQTLSLTNVFGQDTIALARDLKLILGTKFEYSSFSGWAVMPNVRVGWQSRMVLIAEDDEDVRAHAAAILRELGYSVLEAADGPSALLMLDSKPGVRLLFTDIGLPEGLNGRQLADEAQRRRPELQVLYTTAYARNAIVHQGRLDPGVELITKPFTYAAMASKVHAMFERGDSTH